MLAISICHDASTGIKQFFKENKVDFADLFSLKYIKERSEFPVIYLWSTFLFCILINNLPCSEYLLKLFAFVHLEQLTSCN